MVALLIVGWRRSATASTAAMRANARTYGGRGSTGARSRSATVEVIRLPTPPYKRPNIVRRILSLVGSGVIGVLVGVLIAVIVAYTVAFVVIELTNLLR